MVVKLERIIRNIPERVEGGRDKYGIRSLFSRLLGIPEDQISTEEGDVDEFGDMRGPEEMVAAFLEQGVCVCVCGGVITALIDLLPH